MSSSPLYPLKRTVLAGGETTGLLLATVVITMWIVIHIGCIFLWSWRPQLMPVVVPIVFLQAWLSTGLFIIAHDCMHGSLAPGRPRLNTVIGTLCLTLYAALSFRALRPKHYAHHAHPGSESDPDFHPGEPRRVFSWFIRFCRTYYSHAQIARITLVAIVYMLLGASLLNIVIFWAVPAVLALMQLFVFGTYLPHRHTDQPFPDDHRARSNSLSLFGSLVTCFHFGGYHHEHHLSPATPWWRLPKVRQGTAAFHLTGK